MLDEVRNLEAVVVSVEQGVCGLRNEVGTLRKEGDATIGVTEQLQREMHAMREEMAALRSEVAHLRSVNEAQEEQLHQHEERLQRSQLTSSPPSCVPSYVHTTQRDRYTHKQQHPNLVSIILPKQPSNASDTHHRA